MYSSITDGKHSAYTLDQLRLDNPDTSFPENIPVEMLADFGVVPITELPRPAYDADTHYLKQSDIYEVDGHWQVHYSAEPLSLAAVAETMRQRRNGLLSETDWVVTAAYEQGSPVPQVWQEYRQALRDIPDQAGFPFDIQWPSVNPS